jgi:hypothetical protein
MVLSNGAGAATFLPVQYGIAGDEAPGSSFAQIADGCSAGAAQGLADQRAERSGGKGNTRMRRNALRERDDRYPSQRPTSAQLAQQSQKNAVLRRSSADRLAHSAARA